MELIFHIIVGIQHQMHFSELFGCFWGGLPDLVAWARWACSSSPCLWEPAVVLSSSWCMHSSACGWPPTATESPAEAAPRAPGCLADLCGSLSGSTRAYTPGPLLAALGTHPAQFLALDARLSPAADSSPSTCSQASCCTCWLFYHCWQSHIGIHTHTNISNQLP